MKRIIGFSGIIWMLIILAGCSVVLKTEEGRSSIKYEMMDVRDIPEDMRKEIQNRKEEAFKITYRDMEYLYIAEGYGKKEDSEYCVEIAECAETEEAVYIEATLHGPGGKGIVCETEYPFYVIRTEYTEKHVIFEE